MSSFGKNNNKEKEKLVKWSYFFWHFVKWNLLLFFISKCYFIFDDCNKLKRVQRKWKKKSLFWGKKQKSSQFTQTFFAWWEKLNIFNVEISFPSPPLKYQLFALHIWCHLPAHLDCVFPPQFLAASLKHTGNQGVEKSLRRTPWSCLISICLGLKQVSKVCGPGMLGSVLAGTCFWCCIDNTNAGPCDLETLPLISWSFHPLHDAQTKVLLQVRHYSCHN